MKKTFTFLCCLCLLTGITMEAQEISYRFWSAMKLTDVTLPQLQVGDEAVVRFELGNQSPNPEMDFRTIEYTVSINGENARDMQAPVDIRRGTYDWVELPTGPLPEGHNILNISLKSINGQPASGSANLSFIGVAGDWEMSKRMQVVEEFTGTWCQYCVDGIIGMEYMQANHAEDFIGIAVHSDDEFSVYSYYPILDNRVYHDGFPDYVANRDPLLTGRPTSYALQRDLNKINQQQSGVKIAMTAQPGEDGIDVAMSTSFGWDNPEADYRVAIVVTEDGLTGYQTNEYAGDKYAQDGWGERDRYAFWEYKHTARYISEALGDTESLPVNIQKGEEYAYEHFVPRGELVDYANCHIIGMVIDGKSGIILNAAMVGISEQIQEEEDVPTAVVGMPVDDDIREEIYDLSGRQISPNAPLNALPAGIYIVKKGNEVSKRVF